MAKQSKPMFPVVVQVAPLAPRLQILVSAILRNMVQMGHSQDYAASRLRMQLVIHRSAIWKVRAPLASASRTRYDPLPDPLPVRWVPVFVFWFDRHHPAFLKSNSGRPSSMAAGLGSGIVTGFGSVFPLSLATTLRAQLITMARRLPERP